MAQFQIYSGFSLVGWSAFENGDPSMGVAFGNFEPAEGYHVIENECRSNHSDQSSLNLSVQTVDGMTIPCAGVSILDYSQPLEDRCIEVSILGMAHSLYQELFPRQVAM
jgi:hypothetical protein